MTDTTTEMSAGGAIGGRTRQVRVGGTGFANVLIGVDGGRGGRDAIALAVALCNPGGRLTLAHVSAGDPGVNPNFDAAQGRAESRELLSRERDATGAVAELVSVESLTIGRGLHLLAEHVAADLLVVGSCKRGLLGRVLLGDDTRGSLNGAACAVAVAPHAYAERPDAIIKTIGVGYNGTPESRAGLAAARDLAVRHGAALRALTVVRPPSADVSYWDVAASGFQRSVAELTDAAQRRLALLAGVDGRVVFGVPGKELAAFCGELDLLVVGSRGHGATRRLIFGSTSGHLARSGRCPLLVMPRPVAATRSMPRLEAPPGGSDSPSKVPSATT